MQYNDNGNSQWLITSLGKQWGKIVIQRNNYEEIYFDFRNTYLFQDYCDFCPEIGQMCIEVFNCEKVK